jgi:4-hydroxy-tetrahydrodipicolinate reductase
VSLALAVIGASGQMGRSVVRLATQQGHTVVCAVGASDEGRDAGELAGVSACGALVTRDLGAIVGSGATVAIDFSAADLMPDLARACAAGGVALVSGTTAIDVEGRLALEEACEKVPILCEPNMSVGVQVLAVLLERAIALLGAGYDVEIVETHHRLKVDAPSGTAKRLVDVAKAAHGERGDAVVTGRDGKPGRRSEREIGVMALRGGDVIGDHTVHLLGTGERIELTHRATSRDLFAQGAIRAAVWIAGRPAGRYALPDVLT